MQVSSSHILTLASGEVEDGRKKIVFTLAVLPVPLHTKANPVVMKERRSVGRGKDHIAGPRRGCDRPVRHRRAVASGTELRSQILRWELLLQRGLYSGGGHIKN